MGDEKVAVFGGSFDPVHIGHVAFINALIEKLHFKKIIVVPCKTHPFQKNFTFTNKNRLEMLQKALRDLSQVEVSDFELNSTETSYTVHTLKYFKKKHQELTFVCGDDAFLGIESWKEYRELFQLADFLVVTRKGSKIDLKPLLQKFAQNQIANIELVDLQLPEVSSSQIRERLKENKSVENLIPKGVLSE